MSTARPAEIKLTNWFISPIFKNLCGDDRIKNEYAYGLKIEAVKANPAKTQWKVKVGKDIYFLDKSQIDAYFEKHHLDMIIDYLNNFKI